MGFLAWLGLGPRPKPLEVGDPAPDLSVRDEAGREMRLTDFYQDGFTLIYFFPKADTPVCTAQACGLRDDFDQLTERKVRILGVSADSAETLHRFKAKHRLPFPLISDADRRVSQAFAVPTILGMTHRQSFLVQGGRLVWRDLHVSSRWQGKDILVAVKKLT